MPFAMRWPGQLPAGAVYEHPVSALDVVPTALAAAAVTPPQDTLDGVSLLQPVQTGTPAGGGQRTLLWRWQDTFAIHQGAWKLTNVGKGQFKGPPSDLYIAPKYKTQAVRLFNLESDPEETVDVAAEHPQVAQRLQERYDEWVRANSGRY